MPADPPLLRSRASSIRAARSSPRIRWQLDRSIVLADAVPVGWVGELTCRKRRGDRRVRRGGRGRDARPAAYASAQHLVPSPM